MKSHKQKNHLSKLLRIKAWASLEHISIPYNVVIAVTGKLNL